MNFMFGLPTDGDGNTGIVVFVDQLVKMAHLAAVPGTVEFRYSEAVHQPCPLQHGLPLAVTSDTPDPRFTSKFWSQSSRCLALS